MCLSFWPLILKQTVILTAMSNYFMSYANYRPMTDDRRQTESLQMHYKPGHCQMSGVQQLCEIAIYLHVYFIFHVRTASRTVYSHIYVCKT